MSIKGIIFDCDGTLVDSEKWHYLAWQASLKKKGYILTKEVYGHHFTGLGDSAIAKISTDDLGYSDIEDLISHKDTLFKTYQTAGIAPIEPTVAFLKQLFAEKDKWGLKLAVASAAGKEEILFNLESIGIRHYFDVILSGKDEVSEYQDEGGTNKPKPYVYLKTAKLLGLSPEECVAIEDSETGVLSATSAGCFTVAIANEYTLSHDLSKAHLNLVSFANISTEAFFTSCYAQKGKL